MRGWNGRRRAGRGRWRGRIGGFGGCKAAGVGRRTVTFCVRGIGRADGEETVRSGNCVRIRFWILDKRESVDMRGFREVREIGVRCKGVAGCARLHFCLWRLSGS